MAIKAMIFVKLGHNMLPHVVKNLKGIPELTGITSLTGDYDLLLEVRVEEMERLHDIFVESIDPIDGVEETTTMVVLKELLE